MPLIEGQSEERPRPIPYRFLESEAAMFGAPTLAMIDGHFKFLTNLSADGSEDMLFDIDSDIAETTNILDQEPDTARDMRKQLADFIASCRKSHEGQDYSSDYKPINEFQEISGTWK
jgi:type IV secretory pathway ATPase VirB11/archaellum biosynthesis ATPase